MAGRVSNANDESGRTNSSTKFSKVILKGGFLIDSYLSAFAYQTEMQE